MIKSVRLLVLVVLFGRTLMATPQESTLFPKGERGYVRTCRNPVTNVVEQVEVATPRGLCNRQIQWTQRPYLQDVTKTKFKDFLAFFIQEFGISAGNNTNNDQLVSSFKFSPDHRQLLFEYSTRRLTNGTRPLSRGLPNEFGDPVYHAFLYELDTGKVRVLAYRNDEYLQRTAFNSRPLQFSEDGQKVIFHTLDYHFTRGHTNNLIDGPDVVGTYDIKAKQVTELKLILSAFSDRKAEESLIPREVVEQFGELPPTYAETWSTVDCRHCRTPYWAAVFFVRESPFHNRLVIFNLKTKERFDVTRGLLFEKFKDLSFGHGDRIYTGKNTSVLYLKPTPSGSIYSIDIDNHFEIKIANLGEGGVIPRGRVLGDRVSPDGQELVYSSYNEAGWPLYYSIPSSLEKTDLEKTDSVIWFKNIETGALDALVQKYGYFGHDRFAKWGEQ